MHLSLMQDDSPGLKKDDPMILVQPERRAKLYNRPVEVILAYTVLGWGINISLMAWLSTRLPTDLTVGSRCVSDGVLVKKAVFCLNEGEWDCLLLRVSFNNHHYKTCHIKFLDE
ncbi:hypothetical protein C8R45DRAFT_1074245 [Mycena sanguinolenta]|nr:hypothetical protein C8R45DRAFT_1074245 [Mycena sanguinolenta]